MQIHTNPYKPMQIHTNPYKSVYICNGWVWPHEEEEQSSIAAGHALREKLPARRPERWSLGEAGHRLTEA